MGTQEELYIMQQQIDYLLDLVEDYQIREQQAKSKYDHWGMVEIKDIPKPLPNQAIKADKGKPRISLVPPAIIEAIAEVREYGTAKYGESEAWRQVEKQRYVDALLRHTIGYMRNQEGKDEESGIEHIKHMACNIAFLLELDKENIYEDEEL